MNPAEFTSTYYIDRRGSYSRKWDGEHLKFNRTDLLPLWVADMDFMPPQCIQEAICTYVKAQPLGYTMTNPKYLEAVIDWYKRRHNCILSKDWLTSAPNVITGIMWCIGAFTKPNDAIAVLTPVYGAFDTSASDAQRQIIAVPMSRDEDNRYSVDYEAFEAAIIKHEIKLFIHCNPHNPVGHVWTESEMDQLFSICKRHGVLIISDEIHQDLVAGPLPFTSALTISNGAYANNMIAMSFLCQNRLIWLVCTMQRSSSLTRIYESNTMPSKGLFTILIRTSLPKQLLQRPTHIQRLKNGLLICLR